MKKIISLLIIVLFIISLTACGTNQKFSFRGVSWGMTPDQVMKAENSEGFMINGAYFVDGFYLDAPCTISYTFTSDKLSEIMIMYKGFYATYEAFNECYRQLNKLYSGTVPITSDTSDAPMPQIRTTWKLPNAHIQSIYVYESDYSEESFFITIKQPSE